VAPTLPVRAKPFARQASEAAIAALPYFVLLIARCRTIPTLPCSMIASSTQMRVA
jgi:hypothetical protein